MSRMSYGLQLPEQGRAARVALEFSQTEAAFECYGDLVQTSLRNPAEIVDDVMFD